VEEAAQIQIARAYGGPDSVDTCRFRMHHATPSLVDLHSTL
jgi:hypothetical protein